MENARKYLASSALMRIMSAIALLIAAYWQNSFQYYTFLRIAVTFVAAYMIYVGVTTRKHPWVVVFVFIAVVFNPIIPLKEATKDSWVVIDTVVAIVSLVSILFVGENLRPDDDNPFTIFKNRTVQIASGLTLLIVFAGCGVYYYELFREKELRDERIRANANASRANMVNAMAKVANAMANAANAMANAAQKASETTNLSVVQADNSTNAGLAEESLSSHLSLPCEGKISNSNGNVVLRSTPGVSIDNQVQELSHGDRIKLLAFSINKRWIRVRTDDGDSGWISSKLVDCDQ